MTTKKALLIAPVLLFLLASCGDDSAPGQTPDPGEPTTCSLEIRSVPDSIEAAWSVDGPGEFTRNGLGNQTLTDLEPGEYTTTWGDVDGWQTPVAETRDVLAGSSYTFRGVYVVEVAADGIVVDHRAVIDFDEGNIPEFWIDEVKRQGILIHIPGRSHAQQFVGDLDGDPVRTIGGLKTLESMDPTYAVEIQCDLNDLPANGALRIFKGLYNPATDRLIETWECRHASDYYWASEPGRVITDYTATYAANLGDPIDASIFGWSHDIIADGKTLDEDGNRTTFDEGRRDAYLQAIARFNSNPSGTVFFYGTAPIDGDYYPNDQFLGEDGLRSTVFNQDFRDAAIAAGGWMFDQADIENWSSDFSERRYDSYEGQDLQIQHVDWNGTDCAHCGMNLCIAKAKAVWWLAARLAGWDGFPAQ